MGTAPAKNTAWVRDEVDRSTGKIQEKWLCSSPRSGLVLPPTDQKCSLLGVKPFPRKGASTQSIKHVGIRQCPETEGTEMENLQEVWECEWKKAEPGAERPVTADGVQGKKSDEESWTCRCMAA